MMTLPLERWLWGAAIAGIVAPVVGSGFLPAPLKTLSLFFSVGSAGALVSIECFGQDWRKYRKAERRIDERYLESAYGAEDDLIQAQADISHKQAIKEYILTHSDPSEWEHWLNHYEVASLAPLEIASARQLMGNESMVQMMPTQQSLTVPLGYMNQQGMDSIAHEERQNLELDVDWFDSWDKRSGIVCGESGDGKTFILKYVVYRFLQSNQQGKLYICDPDYGSSHGDAPPNDWYKLPLGRVVYIEVPDIIKVVNKVSSFVDQRVKETAIAVSEGEPKPEYEPILLVVDELPSIVARLDKEAVEEFLGAIGNILRRGLKQRVTFKLGTQSLAVRFIKLPQDVLRQIETVMLWRASQVKDNYDNLGIRPAIVDGMIGEVCELPQVLGDRFVCVTFAGKQLQIKGIPKLGEIKVEAPATEQETAIDEPTDEKRSDIYQHMKLWLAANLKATPQETRAEFLNQTGRPLNDQGLKALLEYLAKMD